MNEIDQNKQMARHLAARAIVALRSNFRVERIVVVDAGEEGSGITCDWTQAREPYSNDMKLISRGFAFVYVGTIVDQKQSGPLSDSISKQLNFDMTSAQEAREAAVQWGLVASLRDTDPFAHMGYKLASRLIRADEAAIGHLADYLLAAEGTLNEQQLLAWFELHATPLSLEELEESTTY
jgi:hypothetical protein